MNNNGIHKAHISTNKMHNVNTIQNYRINHTRKTKIITGNKNQLEIEK